MKKFRIVHNVEHNAFAIQLSKDGEEWDMTTSYRIKEDRNGMQYINARIIDDINFIMNLGDFELVKGGYLE